MATLARGQTFGATESVTNTKLHNLVDSGSISGITNADCDSAMALANSKIANIEDAGKVSGSAFYNLASIPSGAGSIPSESLLHLFPVGSVYINITGTNPGTFLGGTWVAFGEGKTLIGLNASDEDFDTAEETGGSKTINIQHNHGGATGNNNTSLPGKGQVDSTYPPDPHTHSISNDLSTTQSIMNPYIVVYFFKRTV